MFGLAVFRASHFVWSRAIIAFVVGLVSWIIAVTYCIRLGFSCVTVVSSEAREALSHPATVAGSSPELNIMRLNTRGFARGKNVS